MDCRETLENLSLLLDGELETRKEKEILMHIHDCWHCKEVQEHEVKLKELIKKKLCYELKVPSSTIDQIKSII
ncbi:MAG: zf-HC2 domain-containing protein [Bacteroidetes bacterium]|nr:zf-HC2 domain-containing protein [Bacteroidota bacterium]